MLEWKDNKYKDENPIKTIHNIRGILSKINLLPIEGLWKNSTKGYYSVSLCIPNTSITSNGKGTSHVFALASAYGELMERVQNLAPFRLSMDFTHDTNEYLGFYHAPDEKSMRLEEILDSKEDWITLQRKKLGEKSNEIINKWKEACAEKQNIDFITIPYLNISTKKLSYIPVKMLCKMYMSNGMCAGNTTQEALIQGICETLERYVNRKIIEEKITPPTVPNSYLSNYPKIVAMIEAIEFRGNYSVIVKDCSLGEGYPVTSVIFIDNNTQKYFVKFGSFPKFESALERTLTELLQGKDIDKMNGLKNFDYKINTKDDRKNIIGIFVNGEGNYPKELFYNKATYEFSSFSRFDGKTGKEVLSQLIKFVEDKGFEIYVRDVSFLGFPAYHVVIPNLSEIDNIEDIKAIDMHNRYNKVCEGIYNLNSLDDYEINNLIKLLDEDTYHPLVPVTRILNIDINFPLPWYYDNMAFLLLTLNCKIKNYKRANEIFKNYLKCMKENYSSQKIPPYYKCVNQYLNMKEDNKTNDQILILLNKFYNEEIIKKVIDAFEPENIINKQISILKCYECEKCVAKNSCKNVQTEHVYRILKEMYDKNSIDQVDLIQKLT